MRRLGVVLLAVLAQLVAGAAAPAPQPPRPAETLIRGLIALVDAGRVDDPAAVSAALGVPLTPGETTTIATTATVCAAGLQAEPSTVTVYTGAHALGPTPWGVASVTRPGFGPVNPQPAEIRGPATIRLSVEDNRDCTGYVAASRTIWADLQVGPLPALDCLSGGELVALFPQARWVPATDGAVVYAYTSAASRAAGASISFDGFTATNCILSIRASQRTQDTPRYRAAQQEQQACMLPHEQRYCRTHPPFGWSDGAEQDRMVATAVGLCGTLDQFLRSTPRDATPAGPVPEPEPPATPCAGVDARLAHRAS